MKDGAEEFQGCCNCMAKCRDDLPNWRGCRERSGLSAGKAVSEIAERLWSS